MILNIFINIVAQVFYFIGIVYLVGFIISKINGFFYASFDHVYAVVYLTGFIGTPIHELSHALMCLLFRHKIVAVKLFQIDKETGVLGYVKHTYNEKKLYQQVGNYFIGVAPIMCGSALLFVCFALLMPDSFRLMRDSVKVLSACAVTNVSTESLRISGEAFAQILTSLFVGIDSWQWWVFTAVALCVSIHMNLSKADIANTKKAVPLLIAFIAVVNIVLGIIGQSVYSRFVYYVNIGGSFIISALLLSMGYSLLYALIAAGVRFAKKGIRRK